MTASPGEVGLGKVLHLQVQLLVGMLECVTMVLQLLGYRRGSGGRSAPGCFENRACTACEGPDGTCKSWDLL